MRRIFLLLSIFFFFISLYLLVFPQKTYAAPPPPKGLWSVSRCVNGEAKVYFYWDISGYTVNGNPVNYTDYNWFLGLGTDEPNINVNDTMPYVYDASSDPPGKTYNWRLRSAEKGTCFFDCNKTVDGPAATRATCGSEPAPTGNTCYYCSVRDGYNVYIDPSHISGESRCVYTPIGCTVGCFPIDDTPPSDGGTCPADQCNPNTGCVDDPDEAQCIAPSGGCNDETNASCRNPSTCTNIYCTVEREGTAYQWTWAYYQQTGLLGTCRPLPSAPDAPPGGECEDDSQCQSGNECVEGRCIAKTPPKQCKVATQKEDCLSGICGEDGICKNDGLMAFACERVGYDPTTGNPHGEFVCQTALGLISTDPEGFSRTLLRWILAFAGGLLLILIIINGYKMMTSQGDPEKLKDAREGIIAAIAGILLIIFSLSILQLITVDIIGIPGFS